MNSRYLRQTVPHVAFFSLNSPILGLEKWGGGQMTRSTRPPTRKTDIPQWRQERIQQSPDACRIWSSTSYLSSEKPSQETCESLPGLNPHSRTQVGLSWRTPKHLLTHSRWQLRGKGSSRPSGYIPVDCHPHAFPEPHKQAARYLTTHTHPQIWQRSRELRPPSGRLYYQPGQRQ